MQFRAVSSPTWPVSLLPYSFVIYSLTDIHL
jgi:hypothetical protein